MSKNILIAAGGTGGHISPGIAIAEYIHENRKNLGIETVYIHSLHRNKDNPDLKESPIPIFWHDIPQFSFTSIFKIHKYIYSILGTFFLLKRLRIDTVIAMGGYSCIPSLLYAIIFKKQIFLCEQNRVIGKVIRKFQGYAKKIAFSFEPVQFESDKNTRHSTPGNPLRIKIYPGDNKIHMKNHNLKADDKINALVMGGSQGARQINNMLLSVLENPEIAKSYNFRLLSGTNLYDETKNKSKNPLDIISYSQDMKTHYEWANIVIARAGAGVISECLLHGLPVVLIPYPFAADNHQAENAEYCHENYGYFVLNQKDEDPSLLARILQDLSKDRNQLSILSQKALKGARPNATKDTVEFFFGTP